MTELGQAAVEVSGASRWYGNVVAVNDVTFRLDGGVTGLLGPNGAGKSTILHMIAGLLAPSSGSVTVAGSSTRGHPELYRKLGLVPEHEAVYPVLTGRQFVRANARLQRMDAEQAAAAAERAINQVDLGAAQDRAIGTYSKGMRQRIKVASALVHDPPVLLLDEPFNGMDPRQRLHLMDLLRRMGDEGRTVLFSSHILEEVEQLAHHIEVVVAGRHAASGDFRKIRRLMTDRPHRYLVRSSDDRMLASALIAHGSTAAIELDGAEQALRIQAVDFAGFTEFLPRIARDHGIRLFTVSPSDESLESVFSYLVTA
jgi:ABC-2 type transport system ATP-binding protein